MHPSRMWRVIRQDDNGNVFVVAEVDTENEARTIAQELEARGHKQLYSIERSEAEAGRDQSAT